MKLLMIGILVIGALLFAADASAQSRATSLYCSTTYSLVNAVDSIAVPSYSLLDIWVEIDSCVAGDGLTAFFGVSASSAPPSGTGIKWKSVAATGEKVYLTNVRSTDGWIRFKPWTATVKKTVSIIQR